MYLQNIGNSVHIMQCTDPKSRINNNEPSKYPETANIRMNLNRF
jgi:hypothetical protein